MLPFLSLLLNSHYFKEVNNVSLEQEIISELLERMGQSFEVRTEKDWVVIMTPYYHLDGEHLNLYIREDHKGLRLSDLGLTFMKFAAAGFDYTADARWRILARILGAYGVTEDEGELILYSSKNSIIADFANYLQGLSKVQDLTFTERPRIKSFLVEDVESIVRKVFPTREINTKWTHPTFDPQRLYLVDTLVNGLQTPLFIFAINSVSRCKDAVITCLYYEINKYKFKSLSILEHQRVAPQKDVKKLREVRSEIIPKYDERVIREKLESLA